MEKLKELVLNYEDSIINDESNKKQMQKYLKIEKHMNKAGLTNIDLIHTLKQVGASSQMSVLNDYLIYLVERGI